MSKKDDIDDLLGDTKPAKKTASKKEDAAPAKEAKVLAAKKTVKEESKPAAKKVAKKEADAEPKEKAKKEADAEPKEKAKKEPIHFEEGERQTIADGVVNHFKRSKKAINSRELAEKLGTETRKLRLVLYSLAKKEVITLTPGESKVTGMTVSPA